jgi:transcriptional regulator with XRE-family HTH domain
MGYSLNHWIIRMSIQQRLITLRREHKLTQQQMSDAIGVHVNQIRRYEAGATQPSLSLDVLKKIALAMSVTIDSLVFGEQERGPEDRLRLQFEAISQFDEEDKQLAQGVLEGLILKHQAKQSIQRQAAAKG